MQEKIMFCFGVVGLCSIMFLIGWLFFAVIDWISKINDHIKYHTTHSHWDYLNMICELQGKIVEIQNKKEKK